MSALRRGAVLVCIALAGLTLAAASAQAKPKRLYLATVLFFKEQPFETELASGKEFRMRNTTGAVFETSVGNVHCPASPGAAETGFVGQLQTNNQTKDKVLIGGPYGSLADERECTSTIALGPVANVYAGFFGTLYLGANHKAELKAAPKEPNLTRMGFGSTFCYYSNAKLKGKLTLVPAEGTGTNFVEIAFTKQKLKLVKAMSNAICPKTATFTVVFPSQITHEFNDFNIYGRLF
jgi:hypothetical protein